VPAPSPAAKGGGAANLAVGRPCREWAAARRRDEQGAPGWACGEGAELRRSAGGAKKGRRRFAWSFLFFGEQFAWSFRVGGGQEDSMQGRGGVWAVQED